MNTLGVTSSANQVSLLVLSPSVWWPAPATPQRNPSGKLRSVTRSSKPVPPPARKQTVRIPRITRLGFRGRVTTGTVGGMFEYFTGPKYVWNLGVCATLNNGGAIDEVDRACRPAREAADVNSGSK